MGTLISPDRGCSLNSASALRYVALACLLAAAQAQTPPTNPHANDAHAAGLGKGAYRIVCAPCHGIRAQGGLGPDLTRGHFNAGETDADLYNVIANGVEGTEMGAYGGRLDPDRIWLIVTYLRSVSQGAAAAPFKGDATRGEALFWKKGGCGACHAVGAKGGHSGPDLSRIGRQRSYAYLHESIVDPSKDITPGYNTLTVVTSSGKKITGIEKGLDDFSGQLIDLSGKFYSFDKDQVESMTREKRSLMPGDYAKRLTADETSDIVAYMMSLKGARQ